MISSLLHHTAETLSPARLLASQLHAGLAEELAVLRVSGDAIDDASLARFRVLADSDDHRMARLAGLAGRLDTASSRTIATLSDRVAFWRLTPNAVAHRAALAAVADVSAALATQAAARDKRMGELDRIGLGWNIILVIAALAALSSVAVLMARERQSLAASQARARRELALREAAESFAGAFTLDDIRQRVRDAADSVLDDHEVRLSPDGEVSVLPPRMAARSADSVAYAAIFGHLATLAIEKVRTLEEAREGRDRLARVLQSRSRLIRGFSHDVKNPIGAADGYAALLSEGIYGELSAEQCDSVRRIRRSIHTALTLIHDLHELAAAETGHLALTTEVVEIGALIETLVDDYQATARGAGLRLRGLADGDSIFVSTSAGRVRQILSNLVSNAIKYSGAGTVELRAQRDATGPDGQPGAWIRISVKDEGRGIPLEQQEFIFEEFGRLAPDDKPGAGLGLAISRLLAQALGGYLTVESQPGTGSTFTLWLPAPCQQESEPLAFRLAHSAADGANARPHRMEEEHERHDL